MSPILIVLLSLYPLIGGGGLVAFVHAARRTSEDWEHNPTAHKLGQALHRAKDASIREPQSRLPSSAG
jgi:hypothetical protein